MGKSQSKQKKQQKKGSNSSKEKGSDSSKEKASDSSKQKVSDLIKKDQNDKIVIQSKTQKQKNESINKKQFVKDDFNININTNQKEQIDQMKKSIQNLSDCQDKMNKSLDYEQEEYSGQIKNKNKIKKLKKKTSAIGSEYNDDSFSNDSLSGSHQKIQDLRLLSTHQEDKQKQVVALIVSFKKGSSYDKLFTSVKQQSMAGTKVLVYACSSSFLPHLINGFKNEFVDETVKQMFKQLTKLDPDCVVFNWQCCSGYSQKVFPQKKQVLFQFLEIIINKGYMAMFSDFSLKALINEWPEDSSLGKNPFVQVGQYSSNICLHFQKQTLINCPSAQLQTVGKMSQNGFCNVHAMGGTIVYSVNYESLKKQQNPYKLQVLTVTDRSTQPKFQCQINDKKGTAGHVLLTYKSGGHILTSMGHWIELMKIDTSQKKLFQIAAQQYGQEYALQRKLSFECLSDDGKRSYVAKKAKVFVQNQAPCNNMERKQRGKKRPVSVQKNSQGDQSD